MSSRCTEQRGVALLLALVALSIVSVATVGIARSSTNRMLGDRHSLRRLQAHLVVESLRPLLLDWVENQSTFVPEEVSEQTGWMTILDEHQDELHLRVERLDLSGRLHFSFLSSHAAQRGLPEELASLRLSQPSEAGADELPPPFLEELAESTDTVNLSVLIESGRGPLLCEWITTAGDGSLSVNACPLPLLEAIVDSMDPELARRILGTREREELVPSGLIRPRRSRSGDNQAAPILTVSSSAYGFRITIEQAKRSSQFWLVIELNQTRRRQSEWVITECRRVRR